MIVIEDMVSFKSVSSEDFEEIKSGLKKLFNIIPYPSNDQSILESFDIVSLGFKISITYYKTGTLLVQGDESHEDFQIIIRFIEFYLESLTF